MYTTKQTLLGHALNHMLAVGYIAGSTGHLRCVIAGRQSVIIWRDTVLTLWFDYDHANNPRRNDELYQGNSPKAKSFTDHRFVGAIASCYVEGDKLRTDDSFTYLREELPPVEACKPNGFYIERW